MSAPQKVKPSIAAALLVPLVIWIVTGIVGGALIAVGISKIPAAVDDLQRAPVGQQTDVELEAGDYRVFIEGDGVNDVFLTPSALFAVADSDGNEVPVDLYDNDTSVTYDFNGHEGRAAWTFEIRTAGTYTVNASSSDAVVENVAFGTQNPLTAGVPMVIVGVVVGGLGFLLALVVMIVMLVRRGRSKKAVFQSQAAQGFPPGYQQGAWGPGYQER